MKNEIDLSENPVSVEEKTLIFVFSFLIIFTDNASISMILGMISMIMISIVKKLFNRK